MDVGISGPKRNVCPYPVVAASVDACVCARVSANVDVDDTKVRWKEERRKR